MLSAGVVGRFEMVMGCVCGVCVVWGCRKGLGMLKIGCGFDDADEKTFDQFVNGKKHALVEFYAPW